jgi:hypothetical protein
MLGESGGFLHAPCFGNFLIVPDNPLFLATTGQGVTNGRSHYDSSLPGRDRCDGAAVNPMPSASNGLDHNGPFGLGATGPAWYRLPVGRSLAPSLVEENHCGTEYTGWLTGLSAAATPPPPANKDQLTISSPADGSLPPAVGAMPAGGFVCFADNRNMCIFVAVRAVACGAYTLWELPPAPGCPYGYCLA